MKAKISWNGEARFLAETESHHTVLMDGPPEHGGKKFWTTSYGNDVDG